MSRSEITEEVMQDMLAAVRVTVNAAIMDYHNVQVAQMQDRISALQERIDKLETALADARSPSGADPSPHGATDGPSGSTAAVRSADPVVRELTVPPEPRTVFGTRQQVSRQSHITARCDVALADLFERDRAKRGFDRDRMMDFILYNFYDRPALSFQIAERDP